MGAESSTQLLDADNRDDAIQEVEGIIEQCKYDYGHAGYTGTFAEAQGITLRDDLEFDSQSEAEDWLFENCEKWGPALIVIIHTRHGIEYMAGIRASS